MNKNCDDFVIFLQDTHTEYHIIVLTETWLMESDDRNQYNLPGYDTFYSNEVVSRCNGVVVFTKSDLAAIVSKVDIEEANCSCVRFRYELQLFNILAVYRSPSAHTATFLHSLNNYYDENIRNFDEQLVLVEDINIDILDSCRSPQYRYDYLTILSSFGLQPLITIPTRVSKNSSTCIDHIAVN